LKDWLKKHGIDLEKIDLSSLNVYSDLQLFKDLCETVQSLVNENDNSYREILQLLNIKLDFQLDIKDISSKFLSLGVLSKNIETLKNNYDVSIAKEF
jgi:arsenate reductase-like glutaredoxin family protein